MRFLMSLLKIRSLLALIIIMMPFTGNAQEGDPKATEVWEPIPPVVDPGSPGNAPSDAIVLFDGKNLDQWTGIDGPAKWNVKNGAMTVVKGAGDIQTKQTFGDVQLHIEWRTPKEVKGGGQGRGNSGIFLQSNYEVQVLDSYDNRTYSNGQAGSIYKQTMPLVNAARKPGEWQTYDIIYRAPRFNEDSLERAATITIIHNGVLVQDHVTIHGTTEYIGPPKIKPHADKLPIKLQDHGDAVSFRNIWLREL